MAVNESRSLNLDLQEGITDGALKKLAPNRGGVVEVDAHMLKTLAWHYGNTVAGSFDQQEAAARHVAL